MTSSPFWDDDETPPGVTTIIWILPRGTHNTHPTSPLPASPYLPPPSCLPYLPPLPYLPSLPPSPTYLPYLPPPPASLPASPTYLPLPAFYTCLLYLPSKPVLTFPIDSCLVSFFYFTRAKGGKQDYRLDKVFWVIQRTKAWTAYYSEYAHS